MIAAWQVRPPRLVTIALARFMIGSQSGSVMSATSTSPAVNSRIRSAEASTRTGPAPAFWPIARPSASTRSARLPRMVARVEIRPSGEHSAISLASFIASART